MRKISYIIALSLITVFLTGHYFIFKSVLSSHKKEFKTYIRSHHAKIEQIEISPSQLYSDNAELKWMDENKELCLNGVMYDIVSIKTAGTKVILNVINDKEEKELMNRYHKQFNESCNEGAAGQKGNDLLKDFLSLKYFQSRNRSIVVFSQEYKFTSELRPSLMFGYSEISAPPPKI